MKKQLFVTRVLNGILVAIIVILIFNSLLALVAIHQTFFDKSKYIFSFSTDGINIYLTALGEYKALFTATVVTIAAYFGLWRYKAAADQNRDKLKQDRFSEWKTVLESMFFEIEKYDPYMKRVFIRIRYNFFNQLNNLNFRISNKAELDRIFQSIFQNHVSSFEIQNNRNIGMGGAHPDSMHSYSFNTFQFLFLGCVDNFYPAMFDDLQTLYVTNLPADRTIDPASYQTALRNYRVI